MYEKQFLEQALEELETLREENEQLKYQICVYEEFVQQTKEILNKWKEKDEKIGV